MEILNLIENNPVSLLISKNNKFNYIELPKLLIENINDPIIYYVSSRDISSQSMNESFKINTSEKYSYYYHNSIPNKNIRLVFLSSAKMKDILLNSVKTESNLDISMIILDFTFLRNMDYDIIMKLWSIIYKNKEKIRIPRLIMININEYITNIPFLLKDNVHEIKKNSINTRIIYNSFSHKITDDYNRMKNIYSFIEKNNSLLEEDQFSTWIILMPSIKKINGLFNFIKEKSLGLKIDIRSYIGKNKNFQLNGIFGEGTAGKRRIIISSSNLLGPITIKNVDGLIDSFLTERDINHNQHKIITLSKLQGEKNIEYITEKKSFCYRLISENHYENIEEYTKLDSDIKYLYKYYLDIISLNLNPYNFLEGIVPESKIKYEIEKMKELKLISNDKIMKDTIETVNLPMVLENSMLIFEAKREKIPLYPVIVTAVIINEINYNDNLIYYRFKENEDKSDIIKRNFSEYINENIIIFYLNIWLKFTRDFKTIKVDSLTLNKWCRENNINTSVFSNISYNIIKIYNILNEGNDIQLGYFNPENLMIKLKPILSLIYKDNLYTFKDKVRRIYTNRKDTLAKIDDSNKKNPLFEYPERLISLKTKFSDNHNYIGIFIPLN